MRILSLFFGHDANCTLLEDGEPVVVLEKEPVQRVHEQGNYKSQITNYKQISNHKLQIKEIIKDFVRPFD